MERLVSIVSRVLFVMAFILAGFAVWEKVANLLGYTVTRGYTPWRLLEFAAVILLFVIGLQLREIKISIRSTDSG
jgi:uncharacterized membrane protein YphA (DoxX/SURF4 family)